MTDTKFTVDKLEVNYDPKSKQYYMAAEYIVEDEDSIRRLTIPKIDINVKKYDSRPFFKREYRGNTVDLGFGSYNLIDVHDYSMNVIYNVKEEVIEYKTHEMTLEEIEKKLGHKVKIISEREK